MPCTSQSSDTLKVVVDQLLEHGHDYLLRCYAFIASSSIYLVTKDIDSFQDKTNNQKQQQQGSLTCLDDF